jgi:hypothetical protein
MIMQPASLAREKGPPHVPATTRAPREPGSTAHPTNQSRAPCIPPTWPGPPQATNHALKGMVGSSVKQPWHALLCTCLCSRFLFSETLSRPVVQEPDHATLLCAAQPAPVGRPSGGDDGGAQWRSGRQWQRGKRQVGPEGVGCMRRRGWQRGGLQAGPEGAGCRRRRRRRSLGGAGGGHARSVTHYGGPFILYYIIKI